MAREQLTVRSEWHPSAKQMEVAEYLAAGYSQNRTSQIVPGVHLRTIQRWWLIEQYRQYVGWLREELMAAQKPLFQSTVATAQALVHGALTGEYSAKDPHVQLATRVLENTLWKHIVPGETPVMGDTAGQLGAGEQA